MPRGRQRDELAKQRILDATYDLVGAREYGSVSINEIAATAGVAKQTIYRWWPSRTAVELDALLHASDRLTPFPETDDVRQDFVHHLEAVIGLFTAQTGRMLRELIAAGHGDAQIAEEFLTRFWAPRRARSLERLQRGIALGQVCADIDSAVVLDALYGPLWTRLLIGHAPLSSDDAAKLVDVVWSGISTSGRPSGPV